MFIRHKAEKELHVKEVGLRSWAEALLSRQIEINNIEETDLLPYSLLGQKELTVIHKN